MEKAGGGSWEIKLGQVSFGYAGQPQILDGVDLNITSDTRLAIIGPSGGGKTSLLRIIAGLVEPTAGRRHTTGSPPIRIGFLAQDDPVLPWRTVARNAELFINVRRGRRSIVSEVLSAVGLDIEKFGGRLPSQLSGGQRRRLGLAMVLAAKPDLFLLDEPGTSLDETTRFAIADLILATIRGSGAGLITVTHDVEEALLFGDVLVVLDGEGGTRTMKTSLPSDRTSLHRFQSDFQSLRAQVVNWLKA